MSIRVNRNIGERKEGGLVITRRENESFYVGDIEVYVAAIRGDKVRIGIKAPKDIPVHREEVYREIHDQQGGKYGPHKPRGK